MKETEVYVKVSVEEKPSESRWYFATDPGMEVCYYGDKEFTFLVDGKIHKLSETEIKYWLKPTTGILLTKEELVKLVRESFDAGWAAMNTYATDSYWTDENRRQEGDYLLKTKDLI